MAADEPDGFPGEESSPSRARRAKALSALAIAMVAVACVAYLRPTADPAPAAGPAHPSGSQVDAVAFAGPATGWVLLDLDGPRFEVLATADGGHHWRVQLAAASMRPGEYMRFFDSRRGVVVTVGGEPIVYATQDGGATWSRHVVFDLNSFAISASFADPQNGWVLMDPGDGVPLTATALVHTVDGGATWTRLGTTVTTAAQPFAVTFTDARHGWLDAVAQSPVAYETADGGDTWRPVALPAPAGGWPVPLGWYFVAVRPTLGGGLVASVVNAAHLSRRDASGVAVLSYPPLTVRSFDGGSAVVFVYSTLADTPFAGIDAESRPAPVGVIPAARQIVMTSLDGGGTWRFVATPEAAGTIGFASTDDWWWLGPGQTARSADAGVTWSAVSPAQLAQPVAGSLVVVDSAHAWVIALVNGSAVLFGTADGGDHWSVAKLPAVSP